MELKTQKVHSAKTYTQVHTVVVYTFSSAFYKCPQEALESTLLSLQWQFGSRGFHKCVWAKSTRHEVHIKYAIWNKTRDRNRSTIKKSLYVSNPLTNLIIYSLIRVRWCTTLILGNVLLNACISSFHYYTSQCAVLGYRELNKLWFIISLNLNLAKTLILH